MDQPWIEGFKRAERSEGLVASGRTDDFSDQPGILFEGHIFNQSLVIDVEETGLRVFL